MGPERNLPDQGGAKIEAMQPVFLNGAELGPKGRRRAQAEGPSDHKGKDIASTEAPENVDDDAGFPNPLHDQQPQAEPGQPPDRQGPQHPVRGPQRDPGDKEMAMEAKPDAKAGESPEDEDREGDGRQRPRRIRSSNGSTATEGQWMHLWA